MTTTIYRNFFVKHPVEAVWNNLTVPDKVVHCVPGTILTERVDEDNYKGKIQLKFGPVKAGYDGLITFLERDIAKRIMSLKGMGMDDNGKGNAEMKMTANLIEREDKLTEVNLSMEISVSGMMARFGSRLIMTRPEKSCLVNNKNPAFG